MWRGEDYIKIDETRCDGFFVNTVMALYFIKIWEFLDQFILSTSLEELSPWVSETRA